MIVAQRWDYRKLRALAPGFVLVSLGLLAAVLVVGPAVNGARRWISFGPAVFQPSELAKLAVAIWAAAYLSGRKPPRDLRELWRPVGALATLFSGLLILEPDMGTAIALLVMLAGMLLVAGTPARTLSAALVIAGALGTAAVWFEPYRRARFFAFLHPWHDAQGTGFQIVQAMIGIGSGHIFGVGLGQGVQKIFYLPEAHTDMMLANIGEELGLVGITAVVAAYGLFGYAGPEDRAAHQGSVRKAARERADGARLRAGRDQHRGRARGRSADRNPAAVPLLRRLEPRGPARFGRNPP